MRGTHGQFERLNILNIPDVLNATLRVTPPKVLLEEVIVNLTVDRSCAYYSRVACH